MTRSKQPLQLFLPLTLLVATMFATTITASPTKVPFKASLAISETVTFVYMAPCFAIGQIAGTGHANHLGKVTATSQDCINPIEPNSNSYQFVSGSADNGLVFTTKKGDQVFATYSGTLTGQQGAPHVIAGDFIITGGTGRFAAAKGGGTMQGVEDISRIVLGEGEVELTGTISY